MIVEALLSDPMGSVPFLTLTPTFMPQRDLCTKCQTLCFFAWHVQINNNILAKNLKITNKSSLTERKRLQCGRKSRTLGRTSGLSGVRLRLSMPPPSAWTKKVWAAWKGTDVAPVWVLWSGNHLVLRRHLYQTHARGTQKQCPHLSGI